MSEDKKYTSQQKRNGQAGPHRGKAPPDGVFSQPHHQIAQQKGRSG